MTVTQPIIVGSPIPADQFPYCNVMRGIYHHANILSGFWEPFIQALHLGGVLVAFLRKTIND